MLIVVIQDGKAGIECFDNGPDFDLVITDLRMPRMDGMQLLRAVRETGDDLPIIVLTAFGTIEQAVEAMREGAFDYLVKPVDRERLASALRRAIGLGELLAENRALRRRLVTGRERRLGDKAENQG